MTDPRNAKEFKYTKLRDRLRKDIVSGRYATGDRLPSETELCARYKLSNNTIREAVLSLVNEGLVSRIRGKGTFVADIRPSRKTLALVIPRMGGNPLDHDYDVMPTYVAAIESEAHEMGWDVLLHVYNNDSSLERQRLLSALERPVDGVISFFSCCRENEDPLREIHSAGIPVVMVDTYLDDLGIDYVGTDNFLGSFMGTKRILDAGFERICYFNSDRGDWNPITPRMQGYIAAMKKFGRHPHVLYPIEDARAGTDWEMVGYEMASQMLAYIQHPFAIFAVTPALAVGAWRAISDSNLPLNEVAIGCFDNPRAVFPQDLLVVNVLQQLEQIGRRAVQIIVEKFNGSEDHCKEMIEPEVVVLESCQPKEQELSSVR